MTEEQFQERVHEIHEEQRELVREARQWRIEHACDAFEILDEQWNRLARCMESHNL